MVRPLRPMVRDPGPGTRRDPGPGEAEAVPGPDRRPPGTRMRQSACAHSGPTPRDGRLAPVSTLGCPSLLRFANKIALMLRADFRSLEEVAIAPDQTGSHRVHL